MKKSEIIQKTIDEFQVDFETKIEKLQKELAEAIEKEREKEKTVYPVLKLIRKYHNEGSEVYKVVNALECWAIKHGYKGYHEYGQRGKTKRNTNGKGHKKKVINDQVEMEIA